VLFSLLAVVAVLGFLAVALGLQDQLMQGEEMPPTLETVPPLVLGLANAGIILVVYGLLGLAGLWFARKLELPGVFEERGGWRYGVLSPALLGGAVGVGLVVIDRVFALGRDWGGFTHPPFPMSLVASATAGIGEEILFRLFMLSLWAWLLTAILGRRQPTQTIFWTANVIAAVAFTAAHLPAVMVLLNAATPTDLPLVVLGELLVLNGIVGLVAGQQFLRHGLVAAVGIHFWADVVWHVIWPATSAA
jgi:hypothetical protein